jgi:hypothetical protein
MFANVSVPRSPADSTARSPEPIIRSKIDWRKNTVLMRSSGISMPLLASTPLRDTRRSDVSTKLVVVQMAYRMVNPISAASTASAAT